MILKIALIIVLGVVNINLHAQNIREQAVEKAVEQLKDAMVHAKSDQLNLLTAAELSYGHSNGLIEDQKSFISALTSGKSDFKSMDITSQTIHVVDHTAIVRHQLEANVIDNGIEKSIKLGVLLIWIEMDGQWKLLARQAFKL